MNINKATLIGHIGKDPELVTTNGGPVCNASLATNEDWLDKQTNQRHERTEWHRLVLFGTSATNFAQHVRKGRLLYIEGRIRTRDYMGKAIDAAGNEVKYADGSNVMVKKYSTEIIVDFWKFMDKNPTSNAYANTQAAAGGVVMPSTPVQASPDQPLFHVPVDMGV